MSQPECLHYLKQLSEIPQAIEKTLELAGQTRRIAARFVETNNWLYLGADWQYPIALEGALKLKEISYIHARACRRRR